MAGEENKRVEVRGFSFIKELLDRKGLPFPLYVDLQEECAASDLAERLGIPADGIEAVFINGIACSTDHTVRPADRVAFVPPGTPGPYRVILGIKKADGGEETK